MSRRPVREPGIRELSAGVYELRVHVARDPLTKRLRQVSRTYRAPRQEWGAGIREARALRARLLDEVRAGRHRGTKTTLGTLLDAWNLQREKMGRSPTTLAEDRRKIDKDVRPALGHRRLDKLTAEDLDRFYAALVARGLSARSVVHYHRAILHPALAQGVKWGWVATNVADLASPPRRIPQHTSRVPSPDDVRRLIDEAHRSKNAEMAGLITVAALSGLRDGELCGLRFCDVDATACQIHVRQVVWQAEGRWGTKPPKSHQQRTVEVDPTAIAVIERRRRIVAKEATALGEPFPAEGWVWSHAALGSRPYMPKAVSQAFRRIRDRAGIDCRFHDLRHFAGTEMVAAGADPRTVADQLGHADPAFTLRIYAAGRTARARQAASALGRTLAEEH